jgi:hypothetical protein
MNNRSVYTRSRALALAVLAVTLGVCAEAQTPAGSAPATNVIVAPSSTQDIRDIRGAKAIDSFWWESLLLAGVSFAGIATYASWRWYRRRRIKTIKLPFEIALQRLEDARALMRPETGRQYSIEVSDAVRQYIESRFQIRAAHRTTHEFLHGCLDAADAGLTGHRSLLAGFLNQCDLAKFARWNLSTEDMESMYHGARTFVLETAASMAMKPTAATYQLEPGRQFNDPLPST